MCAVQVEKTQKEREWPAEGGAALLSSTVTGHKWQLTDHSLLFLDVRMHLTGKTHCHQLPTKTRKGDTSNDKKRTHSQPFLGIWGLAFIFWLTRLFSFATALQGEY